MAQPAKKTDTTQNSVTVFDTFWDGWLNQVKLAQSYQQEWESATVQAVERQKEVWKQARGNMEKLEGEYNQLVQDAKTNFLANVRNANVDTLSKNVEEWSKRLEEINERVQQLYGTPGKACGSLVGKSIEQLESTVNSFIAQQQKSREEVASLLENFTEQVKKTNKGLLEAWEVNRNSMFQGK